MIFRLLLLLGLLATLLSSCSPMAGIGTPNRPYLAGLGVSSARTGFSNPAESASFWDGDSVSGPSAIRINRDDQRAYFYKGGELVGVSPISTGNATHVTPPGQFRVTEKDIDHKSSAYGIIQDLATGQVVNDDADASKDKPGPGQVFVHAPMPHFLRFNYGVGMHAGFLPGFPASHGCVRMPEQMAKKFYEHATIGTPVTVE